MLYKLIDIGTMELSETHAAVVIKCYELHAFERPIPEEDLLQVPNVTHMVITELEQMGCIELREGYVRLEEDVCIR